MTFVLASLDYLRQNNVGGCAWPFDESICCRARSTCWCSKCLGAGPNHGYGIATRIHELSDDVLRIEEGSLYPALYRMEEQGLITSEWRTTENNRNAKFYRLTSEAAPPPARSSKAGTGCLARSRACCAPSSRGPDMPIRLPRRLRRFLAPFTWNARDQEMDREMGFHLESIRQQYVQSGMSEADAARAARTRFGDLRRLKERGHDVRTTRLVDDLVRDVRHMARGLRKSPGFTVAVILTLGARDRRQHRDLLGRRPAAAAAAAVSGGRPAGDHLRSLRRHARAAGASGTHPPIGVARQLAGLAGTEPHARAVRCVAHDLDDADAVGRSDPAGRADGVGGVLSAARRRPHARPDDRRRGRPPERARASPSSATASGRDASAAIRASSAARSC